MAVIIVRYVNDVCVELFLYYTNTFCITLIGTSCAAGDLSLNSKCYAKFDGEVSWYAASNDCLLHAESLALFADIGRLSDSTQLTDWLSGYGTNETYWIGLVKSGWRTTDEGYRRSRFFFFQFELISFFTTFSLNDFWI